MSSDHAHLLACPSCGTTNRVPASRLGDQPQCGRCGEALLPGHPVVATDENFDALVARSPLPVVVDFWAPWCGPCRTMAPQFEQAAARLQGQVLLVKVNSDESPRTSARFGIRSIPTLVRLSGGRETGRVAGARPAEQIVAWARSGT